MPRTLDGESKRPAVSPPRASFRGSDRRFWDAAARVRLPRRKPLAGSADSAAAPMAGGQQRFVDTDSGERWFYFATAVFLIALIATFGTLIWQIARAFK